MKNQIKKTFSLFLVFAIVFMTMPLTAFAAPWEPTELVDFTDDAGGTPESKWPKKYAGNDKGTAVVFCINIHKNAVPKDNPTRFYLNEDAVDTDGVPYLSTAVTHANEGDVIPTATSIEDPNFKKLKGLLRKVLAYGYCGGDPRNLFPGFSDGKLYEVTQAAVYQVVHYGNLDISGLPFDGDPEFNPSNASREDVEKLLKVAYDEATPEPEGELYLFVSMVNSGNGMSYATGQNLIGGAFTVPDVPEEESPEPVTPTVKTKVNPNEIEAAPDQTFVDTVTLTGLQEGVEYTITGKLMDKAEQAEVTATCEPYTFTATAEDAAAESVEKEMTFTVDASELAGKELVVFETLSWTVDGEGKSVEHNDFDDSDQTVTVKEKTEEPKVPTVTTKVSPNEIEAKPNQTFIDTVILTNLQEGVEYTITGKLMDKAEQAEVTATCEPITFVATAEDAAAESVEKEMEFTVDATDFAEKELVVFETLSWTVDGKEESVEHNDYEDADQTVTVKKAPSAPGTPGEEEVGQFTVKKTVDASADAETVFEITVFFQYPDGETKEEVIKISSIDDPVLFEKVPAGTKVTISEDAPGYQMTCKVGEEVTTEFTIANGDNLEVVVNNSFVPEVPKDLGGEEPEATPEDTPEDTPEQKPATPTEQTTGGQKETKQSTSKNPKTGDESDMALWILLFLGAAASMAVADKKRNHVTDQE